MKNKRPVRIIVANSIIGTILLWINYNSNWNNLFVLNLIIHAGSYLFVFVFITLALSHIRNVYKQRAALYLTALVYILFLINLFLNPFRIDRCPNNTFKSRMSAMREGTFTLRRIIFDTSNHFYMFEAEMFKVVKQRGTYTERNDSIFLNVNNRTSGFRDTLLIDKEKSLLHISTDANDMPLHLYLSDSPHEVRLNMAKRTHFELIP